jgi:hypothetical protein
MFLIVRNGHNPEASFAAYSLQKGNEHVQYEDQSKEEVCNEHVQY